MSTHTITKAWSNWWLRDDQPHVLAIFRIAFGSFLLLYMGLYLPKVTMVFSNSGITSPLYAPDAPQWIRVFLTAPDPWIAHLLFALLLLGLIGFTIGYRMRLCLIVVILLALYHWQLSMHLFPTSYNRIFFFALIVLLFSGADKTYSLRMKLQHGSWAAAENISILPQRLLAMQIAVTYFGVGWQKIFLEAWQGGEVLSYALVTRWATTPAYAMIRWNLPMSFWDASVFTVTLFECFIPFALWFRPTRRYAFVGGTIFHILIAILLAIWWFLFLIPSYILFFEPKEVRNRIGCPEKKAQQ